MGGGGLGRWDKFVFHEERKREREFRGTFLVILLHEFIELKFTMGERV